MYQKISWTFDSDQTATSYRDLLCSEHLGVTKTGLYSFYPLKPHFYKVNLGFAGVSINFLISAQKIQIFGTRLNHLAEAGLTSTHNLCFKQKYEKYPTFFWKFSFFGGEIFSIFE